MRETEPLESLEGYTKGGSHNACYHASIKACHRLRALWYRKLSYSPVCWAEVWRSSNFTVTEIRSSVQREGHPEIKQRFKPLKCYSDEPLAVPLEGLHVDDKLRFVEEPVEIMDREVKRLKQSRIPIVKVRTGNSKERS
ncbi:hypothetical protein Tco_0308738 [Tanacetum coccineum]